MKKVPTTPAATPTSMPEAPAEEEPQPPAANEASSVVPLLKATSESTVAAKAKAYDQIVAAYNQLGAQPPLHPSNAAQIIGSLIAQHGALVQEIVPMRALLKTKL